jgi:hypothetical protein
VAIQAIRVKRRSAAVPAIYLDHAFAETGGLMSYGANLTDAYRVVAG